MSSITLGMIFRYFFKYHVLMTLFLISLFITVSCSKNKDRESDSLINKPTQDLITEIQKVEDFVARKYLLSNSTKEDKSQFLEVLEYVKTLSLKLNENPFDKVTLDQLYQKLMLINSIDIVAIDAAQLQNFFTVSIEVFSFYKEQQKREFKPLEWDIYYGVSYVENPVLPNDLELVSISGDPPTIRYEGGRQQLSFSAFNGPDNPNNVGESLFVLKKKIKVKGPVKFRISQAQNFYDMSVEILLKVKVAVVDSKKEIKDWEWVELPLLKVPKKPSWNAVISEWYDLSNQYSGKTIQIGFFYESKPNISPAWAIKEVLVQNTEGVKK